MQRLTTANEAVVEIGQKGEDDDLIQYQIQRAEQGDLPSMEALGELYYWGARGVARDQARALQYFTSALLAGSNNARCAAAVSGLLCTSMGPGVGSPDAWQIFWFDLLRYPLLAVLYWCSSSSTRETNGHLRAFVCRHRNCQGRRNLLFLHDMCQPNLVINDVPGDVPEGGGYTC